jgi:DUF438 domain-containing protein
MRSEILVNLGRTLTARPLTRNEIDAVSPIIDLVEPADLADAVHALVMEGIAFDALKPAVSRLINLVSKPLGRVLFAPTDPFFESLVLENAAFLRELGTLRPLVARLAVAGGEKRALCGEMRRSLESLAAIGLHYVKKENILFPHFEARYPRYRCISLMWALHDDVRSAIPRLIALLDVEPVDAKATGALLGRLFFDAHALAFREEKVIFPIVAGLLGLEERRELYAESRALGFCFLSPETVAALDDSAGAIGGGTGAKAIDGGPAGGPDSLSLDSGSLEPRIVDLILRSLPVDITFVDAEDKVAYFSNGAERVFPRSPAIIGRDVRNCHPAKSVDKVLGVIEAFRRGERDYEEFWLESGGRFVRIEYRAMRDATGKYLGTLEVSQDLTGPRSLEGEKRLVSS